MTSWEDGLPPRVRERLEQIGDLTPEEKQRMKDDEVLSGLVVDYFKGELSTDDLWQKLKAYKDEGKTAILKDVQIKIMDAIRFGTSDDELASQKKGLVAIESLKDEPDMALFEQGFDAIANLKRQYEQEKTQVYQAIKGQVEQNPDLRMQQVQQGGQRIVMQLSVEDAIKMNPQYKNFLTQHETKYNQAFSEMIDGIRTAIK
ncbi:hypothetical protein ACFLXN_02815 [Chloroflexota bacterium]